MALPSIACEYACTDLAYPFHSITPVQDSTRLQGRLVIPVSNELLNVIGATLRKMTTCKYSAGCEENQLLGKSFRSVHEQHTRLCKVPYMLETLLYWLGLRGGRPNLDIWWQCGDRVSGIIWGNTAKKFLKLILPFWSPGYWSSRIAIEWHFYPSVLAVYFVYHFHRVVNWSWALSHVDAERGSWHTSIRRSAIFSSREEVVNQ